MHTVRGGKSLMRLGYDQVQGGGYQGLPVNDDPAKTNLGGGQTGGAPQQSGWALEYAELVALIEDIPTAVDRLDRLVMSDPSIHNAMTGETGWTARPSPPEADEPPPGGARDQFKPMNDPMAVDWRPKIKGPHSTQAIRGFVAQGEMKRRLRDEAEFYKRFPTASRLRRAF